jgi:hypothetical protein
LVAWKIGKIGAVLNWKPSDMQNSPKGLLGIGTPMATDARQRRDCPSRMSHYFVAGSLGEVGIDSAVEVGDSGGIGAVGMTGGIGGGITA